MTDFSFVRRVRAQAAAAPLLGAEEEREAIRRFQRGDRAALERVVRAHLRLVLAIVERYAHHGVPMEDLIGEGIVGLMEAARRFEDDKGSRFGTYAAWWVRAYVRRYALQNRRIVSVPSTRAARRVLWGMRRAEREIAQREGRSASREEVAERLGVTSEDVEMVVAAMGGADVPIGVQVEGRGFDVPDDCPSPEDCAVEWERRERLGARVAEAIARLDCREREIVRRRLLEEEGVSLASLGQRFGVSRERVRQLQRRAESKLRSALLEQTA